jgi:hypothetical protein
MVHQCGWVLVNPTPISNPPPNQIKERKKKKEKKGGRKD